MVELLASVAVATLVALSLEVPDDALVPADAVPEVGVSADAVDDTPASADTDTSVALCVDDVEDTAASAEVARGVVPPEVIIEKEVDSVVDVRGVWVSPDVF